MQLHLAIITYNYVAHSTNMPTNGDRDTDSYYAKLLNMKDKKLRHYT